MLRWALGLQVYQFESIYKPGKQHRNVDYISRLPVQEEKVNQVRKANSWDSILDDLPLPKDPTDVGSMVSCIQMITQMTKILPQNQLPEVNAVFGTPNVADIPVEVKPTKEEDTPRIKILQQTDPACQKIITYLKNQGKVYHPQDETPKTTEKIAAGCWIDEQLDRTIRKYTLIHRKDRCSSQNA